MKKNYFYSVLQEEFSLLSRVACARDSAEIADCKQKIQQRHEGLTHRLFREFITPLERRDLYEISFCISEAVSVFSPGFSGSRNLCDAVRLLTSDPLRFDSGILPRYAEFRTLWEASCREGKEEACFRCLNRIFQAMIKACLGNV